MKESNILLYSYAYNTVGDIRPMKIRLDEDHPFMLLNVEEVIIQKKPLSDC